MIKHIYTIYDCAAEAYMEPWFTHNNALAKRAFTGAANDKEHPIGTAPHDYTLFHIGTWDDKTGELNQPAAKTSMGTAIEYVLHIQDKKQSDLFDNSADEAHTLLTNAQQNNGEDL